MMLITPAIASEPYTAEEPSLRISIRSTALSGIELRLKPLPWPTFGSAYGAGATRRPLSSTRVATEPRPRRDAVELPAWKPVVLPKSVVTSPEMAGMSRSSSARFVCPLRSICSRVMIWTGAGVSVSVRLMFEPVTSIFSLAWAVCCADAWPATNDRARLAPSAVATAVQSLVFCVLIVASDLGWTAGTDGVLWTAALFLSAKNSERQPHRQLVIFICGFFGHRRQK